MERKTPDTSIEITVGPVQQLPDIRAYVEPAPQQPDIQIRLDDPGAESEPYDRVEREASLRALMGRGRRIKMLPAEPEVRTVIKPVYVRAEPDVNVIVKPVYANAQSPSPAPTVSPIAPVFAASDD